MSVPIERSGDPHLSQIVELFEPSRQDHVNPGALYARALLLRHAHQRTILATYEDYTKDTPGFPIWASHDDGETWSRRSTVVDQVNGFGLRFQPFLFELQTQIGELAPGTLLASGLSFRDAESPTYLEVYRSDDHGHTWSYLSRLASGGSFDEKRPIWEPYIIEHEGRLIAYYSDERDPRHNQKTVHAVSRDGLVWTAATDDVALDSYEPRPGMPIVTRMGDGRYLYVVECIEHPDKNALWYKLSSDPTDFGSPLDLGAFIWGENGTIPGGTPYATWLPVGAPQGALVVSGLTEDLLLVNVDGGAPDRWFEIHSPVPRGYSRALLPLDESRLLVISAGVHQQFGWNTVRSGVIDVAAVLHSRGT